MDPVLKDMLHDPITIAPYTGHDAYGKPTYGAPVAYLGRIQRAFDTEMGASGPMLLEKSKMYVDETTVVDTRSQLTIEGKVVPIQGVKPVQDEHGDLDHYILYL